LPLQATVVTPPSAEIVCVEPGAVDRGVRVWSSPRPAVVGGAVGPWVGGIAVGPPVLAGGVVSPGGDGAEVVVAVEPSTVVELVVSLAGGAGLAGVGSVEVALTGRDGWSVTCAVTNVTERHPRAVAPVVTAIHVAVTTRIR
jgi:hypothetical protein